ncbi:MAG TPA: ATP synthase F1 subunit delta [Elusimicrobiota bacterium]|nr:ATP synthase F1 subunit delta [Elusimicrobiota bacterium]
MRDTIAARKYAQALFEEAKEHDQMLACQQGLQEMIRLVRLRKSLSDVLVHPFISSDDKERMIHSALGEYATPLLERFLFLLIKKHRFGLLVDIADLFQEAVDRYQNVQDLHVRTAFPLTDAQAKKLLESMQAWLKAKVRMDVRLDPELIGGLVIQTRDRVLDQSLKGQLARLEQRLIG